jgi:hypothetical protein
MSIRIATTALISVFMLTWPSVAHAQSGEDIYDSIEQIHGDADGFFKVLLKLQDAVAVGEPAAFAGYALYPIMVRANGEMHEVREAQDLVDNFDSLVSPETLEAIVEQDIDDLIVTDDGVGVGNGALWITNICLDDDCLEGFG